MKKIIAFALSALLLCTMVGCSSQNKQETTQEPIPFAEDQWYAVAYLGYENMDNLAYYQDTYLGGEKPPIQHISDGEYYLIIPRYDDMYLQLYQNDMETFDKTLIYEKTNFESLIVQCNISDIFPDATILLTHDKTTIEFSPFISLKDGSVQIGEQGLDITKTE